MSKKSFPGYTPLLDAYHAAFALELQSMVKTLPFASGDSILDMGCGDGTYSGWIADRVAPDGQVTAVDLSDHSLHRARAKLKNHPQAKRIHFRRGNIKRLPFEDNTFDGVWCAQSFISFPDPLDALKELARVVRPNGSVAVLENDIFHQVLLPWPIPVELALSRAQYQAFLEKGDHKQKAYVGRHLRLLFVKAGLKPQRKCLFASQREHPFSKADQKYLRYYVRDVRRSVKPYVDPLLQKTVDDLLNPSSSRYLLNQPQLSFTCLDHLMWGKKPSNNRS